MNEKICSEVVGGCDVVEHWHTMGLQIPTKLRCVVGGRSEKHSAASSHVSEAISVGFQSEFPLLSDLEKQGAS